MANPQPENGYIPVAREIIEAIARHTNKISPDELRCIMVIWLKTWGWKKREDRISLSQFSNLTGMKRPNVCRSLSRLEKKGLIIRSDNRKGIIYRFQKDFDQWKALSDRITLSDPITGIIRSDTHKRN